MLKYPFSNFIATKHFALEYITYIFFEDNIFLIKIILCTYYHLAMQLTGTPCIDISKKESFDIDDF